MAASVSIKTHSFPKSIVLQMSVSVALLGTTNPQCILFIVKGFPSHPLEFPS